MVFTPQMLHVMSPKTDKFSGENVSEFVDVCRRTFTLLRSQAKDFISLFTLMTSAGLPELKFVNDVGYMKEKLGLRQHFEKGNRLSHRRMKQCSSSLRIFEVH